MQKAQFAAQIMEGRQSIGLQTVGVESVAT